MVNWMAIVVMVEAVGYSGHPNPRTRGTRKPTMQSG
jgi:hypothetical protein